MKKPHIIRLAVFVFIFSLLVPAQQIRVEKLEPANWWTKMNLNEIQLMVYGKNLSNVTADFFNSPIIVKNVHVPENNNYCFIDIKIPNDLQPGNYELTLKNSYNQVSINFPILNRELKKEQHQGFSNKDVIYLITPDRFCNGDITNDTVEGMKEGYDNSSLGRHGGDLQGIINKLNYLKDLGITAIWINPLVENDTKYSYHGYAATDFYNIDNRFGTNQLYKKLVEEAHKLDIKIIWDHVANHCSIDHPWLKNLPMADWINGSIKNHLPAMHHKMVLSDPHGNTNTKDYLQKGWFVDSMPDLNQKNPFVAKYIIQNTIWWMEYSGLDGIREDTYPYADQKFLADWAKAVLDEYPNSNIVGEVWTGTTAFLAYYQKDSYLPREFDSNLPSVTDFGIRDVYYKFLKGENNLYNIYETFSKDYLYPNPDNLVTFIDNHDVTRTMLAANGNINKAKLALGMLFTTRGIPQILYGTEIGMKGGEDHGLLRADFPGGFKTSTRDAFIAEGRTDEESAIFNYVQKLLQLRKKYKALSIGKMIHFPPHDGIYIYIKKYENSNLVVVVNENDTDKNISLDFLSEEIKVSKNCRELIKNDRLHINKDKQLGIKASSLLILEFKE